MQHDGTLITRQDAYKAGRDYFYTGKQCKYGHLSLRFVTTGACVQCNRERGKMFYRTKHGASARLFFDNIHPDDVEPIKQFVVTLQTQRDIAAQNRPQLDIAKERLRLYPDLKTLPPGHVFPPFEPHPGTIKKE